MHQTTVRFGVDLWEALEEECRRLGVSAAQYLREAALARLVYTAGRRGDDEFELALELATGRDSPSREAEPDVPAMDLEAIATPAAGARSARLRAEREAAESAALWSQGRQARRRAQELRQEAAARRAEPAGDHQEAAKP